jgi:hypothetical protein
MTTDEMDRITLPERDDLIAQCKNCGEWIRFSNSARNKIVSQGDCKCGGEFDTRSIQTYRSFNQHRVKNRDYKRNER